MSSKHVPVEGKEFGVQVGCSIIHAHMYIHFVCIQLYTHTCAHMHKHMHILHIHLLTYTHAHFHTQIHTDAPW